ncbi:transposase [Lewinella sp. JB7]|uniref:transposase n=1 Tax=Lewinella sp. JB7 TaxID=2962887 RepID=UPI0020C9BCDA|nr:transposase [Lewinella sp. JB7]MCP9237981.1 transposase [Lewinella sp. JB7]
MDHFTFVLGCDVAKHSLSLCLLRHRDRFSLYRAEIPNTGVGVRTLVRELLRRYAATEGFELSQCRLIAEHTGIYTADLCATWLDLGGRLSLVDARRVQASLGSRYAYDKTDALDAVRLAEYGSRFADQLQEYVPPRAALSLIAHLHSLRKRLLLVRDILEQPLGELAGQAPLGATAQLIEELQQRPLEALRQSIVACEQQLAQVIAEDEALRRQFELVRSVSGVGQVCAWQILVLTGGFTRFTAQDAKAFCRYIGIVPRRFESGSSIYRHRGSPKRRGGSLKADLSMGLLAAIQYDPDLKTYYRRKRAAGKTHRVVANAVKNKIIERVFAVVRRGTTYQKNYQPNLQAS